MHSQKKKKIQALWGDLLPATVSTVRLCLIEWELSRILATHLFDICETLLFSPEGIYRKKIVFVVQG